MRGMMVRNAKKEYGLSYQNLLFVSPENGIMKPRAADAQMICGCEYVGIPLRTMHKIRKTVASDLFDAGVSLTDIAGLLGHSSIQTTINHYIFNNKSREESARRVTTIQEELRRSREGQTGNQTSKMGCPPENPQKQNWATPGHRSRNAKRARKPFYKGVSGTSKHAGDGT